MKSMLKRVTTIFVIAFLIALSPLKAQEETSGSSNFSIGADLVSRYIWRGLNLGGSSPNVQPYLEYSFGKSGLAIGAWGSYSLGYGTAGTEADLYLSYTPVDPLTITVTDYFFPSDVPFGVNDYFNYKKDQTGHTFEGMITFNGTESFPVYATFAMNFYGVDGTDENGDNYNAKYLEVGYNGSAGDVDLSTFMGLALDDPKEEQGAAGWYGNSFGVINLGITASKTLNLGKVALPASSSLIFNPEAGNIYIVFGVSL